MQKKKKVGISLVLLLLVVGIIIGVSYAWWSATAVQTSVNKITSDCLELQLVNDKNEINLTSAYPVKDSEAMNLIPYEFTIQNVCNLDVEYNMYLEMLDIENRIGSQYIGVSLNNAEKQILGNLEETTPILANMKEGRILAKKQRLNASKSVTYKLRLWIDESVTISDNVQNKEFQSKVVLEGEMATPVE